MGNLDLYNAVRNVPTEAQKSIGAGRLKGMTDINPMWRIKKLTEQFGVCGIGWYPEIIRTWLDNGANGEITANVELKLYIKHGDSWSMGIPGIGGSKLVAKETAGLYTDDECYKKAYTDALSVACKSLGMGADVYFEKDKTKYDVATSKTETLTDKPKVKKTESKPQDFATTPPPQSVSKATDNSVDEDVINDIWFYADEAGQSEQNVLKWIYSKFNKSKVEDLNLPEANALIKALREKAEAKKNV